MTTWWFWTVWKTTISLSKDKGHGGMTNAGNEVAPCEMNRHIAPGSLPTSFSWPTSQV